MRKRERPRDPLLLEVAAAIGAGRLTIGPIHEDGMFVHGYEEGGRIRINPAVDTVDTAVHESIHRLRPRWSERAVRAKTTRLMRQMSYHEIDRLYEVILGTAKKSKRPIKLE